jgi:hypothetical protein
MAGWGPVGGIYRNGRIWGRIRAGSWWSLVRVRALIPLVSVLHQGIDNHGPKENSKNRTGLHRMRKESSLNLAEKLNSATAHLKSSSRRDTQMIQFRSTIEQQTFFSAEILSIKVTLLLFFQTALLGNTSREVITFLRVRQIKQRSMLPIEFCHLESPCSAHPM